MKKIIEKKSLVNKIVNKKNKSGTKPSDSFARAITENLYDYGVFSMDTKGAIKSWNKGAEKLFGYKEEEVIGKNYSLTFVSKDRSNKLPDKELKQAIKKSRTIDERYYIRKNSTVFLASGIVFPIEDEKHVHSGFTKILTDISEQREFEKRKDEFISTATHEIRSPITSMKLFADIVRNKTKNINSTSLNDSVLGLNKQIDRLIALTDYLLDVSKIQGGKLLLEKKKFNINNLIEFLVKAMRLTSSKHTLLIHSDVKKLVYGDEERISQVITNLLSNAIKYSPKGGTIIITTSQQKSGIEVRIQDFGLGISKSEQNKLFTRFFRADIARKKNITGIGLGLYIARKIINGHGGEMGMESVKGKGSTFSFSIPAKDKVKT